MRFACLESEENDPESVEIPDGELNMATRWVNIPNALGAVERGDRPEECSSIIATGVNGGGPLSCALFRMYAEYIGSFTPMQIRLKPKKKNWGMCLGHISIRNGPCKPVRIRAISGETKLLSGMDTVKKLDITVCFGSDRFKVGQGEGEMVTFHENRHWAFPLVPTACAYAKPGEYFGKLRSAGTTAVQMHGRFW